ncbi:MAG TPA: hypothetical protein VMH30_01025 [Verrucomicrobiae bacterium]|nr:hypothetical protein [Verrucomicrobiae bacterium]
MTKVVQGSTTGKTTITFDAPAIYDTNALSAIQSLAIWPEKQTQQAGLVRYGDFFGLRWHTCHKGETKHLLD